MALKILSGPLRLGSGGGLQIKRSAAVADAIAALPGYLDRWRSDTIGLTNGASIPSWTSVGGTRSVTQATGAKQPTYNTTGLNSKGVAHFAAASSQIMAMGTPLDLGTTHTVYVVVRRSGATSGAVIAGSTGTVYPLFIDAGTGVYYREGGGSLMTGSALADATWKICAVVRNGTAVTLYQDTTQTGSGTLVGTNSCNFATMGGTGGGTAGTFTGDVADVVFCNAAHGSTDRSAAVTALQAIWGAV